MIRRSTPTVTIDNVLMGTDHPVVVQSMTNTPTANVSATAAQIKELADAGSELVRITVNDFEAAKAVPDIKKRLTDVGCNVPLIGDFHYNGHVLLTKHPETAQTLAKYRINPGNVGKGAKRDENFATMIEVALSHQKPVRIGVNWGSLDQDLFTTMMDDNAKLPEPKSFKNVVYDAMVKSALDSAQLAESLGLPKDKIVLSVKMSDVQDMIHVYRQLSEKCNYVLHLGLTEAGGAVKGITASAAALGILLNDGIGDTIRMSLTPEPGKSRALEVQGCTHLLQSLGLRFFMPSVISCPGCGRTDSDGFIHLAKDINTYIEDSMPTWKESYPGVEKLTIAVMGCVVNGPGESKFADIGISLPGTQEDPSVPVYKDGKFFKTLKGNQIKKEFITILDTYISEKYSLKTAKV
ncbi:MAG: flavodoxin-dependent (E)-4-hydroxy-3-methylbut-2-enyl-diphosphate synthase [Candidatus Margulisbacteria bacterium]|nr:flavodoxin-dependent (E)-4-hydroxy-3-methylbut-2-enyl-diphosphate synthase [Candidatus Margulisiibacteriota bacterium]